MPYIVRRGRWMRHLEKHTGNVGIRAFMAEGELFGHLHIMFGGQWGGTISSYSSERLSARRCFMQRKLFCTDGANSIGRQVCRKKQITGGLPMENYQVCIRYCCCCCSTADYPDQIVVRVGGELASKCTTEQMHDRGTR